MRAPCVECEHISTGKGGNPEAGMYANLKGAPNGAGAQRLQLHPDLPSWMADAGARATDTPADATWLPARSAVVLVQPRQ